MGFSESFPASDGTSGPQNEKSAQEENTGRTGISENLVDIEKTSTENVPETLTSLQNTFEIENSRIKSEETAKKYQQPSTNELLKGLRENADVFLSAIGYAEMPFSLNLSQKIEVPENPKILDIDSPLGEAFLAAGVEPKGDENLFPAMTPDGTFVMLTYRMRAMITKHPDTFLEEWGGSYREMVESPEEHQDFWKKMGVSGPLLNWGTASVPCSKGAVLLGKKEETAVTYANQWGPPAGIFEVPDREGMTLREALIESAARELCEETGAPMELVKGRDTEIKVEWDVARCKPQAFVRFEFTLEELAEIRDATPLEKEFDRWNIVNLSSEGFAALILSR